MSGGHITRILGQAMLHGRDSTRRALRFSDRELNLRTRRQQAPDGRSVQLIHRDISLLNALRRAPQRGWSMRCFSLH